VMRARRSALRRMIATYSRFRTGSSSSASANPRMAVRGVLNSWEMFTASSRLISSRRLRSVMSTNSATVAAFSGRGLKPQRKVRSPRAISSAAPAPVALTARRPSANFGDRTTSQYGLPGAGSQPRILQSASLA